MIVHEPKNLGTNEDSSYADATVKLAIPRFISSAFHQGRSKGRGVVWYHTPFHIARVRKTCSKSAETPMK